MVARAKKAKSRAGRHPFGSLGEAQESAAYQMLFTASGDIQTARLRLQTAADLARNEGWPKPIVAAIKAYEKKLQTLDEAGDKIRWKLYPTR